MLCDFAIFKSVPVRLSCSVSMFSCFCRLLTAAQIRLLSLAKFSARNSCFSLKKAICARQFSELALTEISYHSYITAEELRKGKSSLL